MGEPMAGSKTIYNSTGLECLAELLARQHGLVLDQNFLKQTVKAVARDNVTVTLEGLERGVQNLPGRYGSKVDFVYRKLPLALTIPADLAYGGVYPVTGKALRDELLRSYDLYLEASDIGLHNPGQAPTPLTDTMIISRQPGVGGAIVLQTLDSSLRFYGQQNLNLYITGDENTDWTRLQLTGDAPDSDTATAYTYQYTVAGGVAPYSYEIVSGTAPVPLNPATGKLEGVYHANGALSWTVRVTDARGFTADLTDSCTIALRNLAITRTSLVAGVAGTPYSADLGFSGGAPSYVAEITGTVPDGLSVSSVGILSGNVDFGTYTFGVKITDQNGQSVSRNYTLNIASRATQALARAVIGKVSGWFEFTQGSFRDGEPVEATYVRGTTATTLVVRGDAVAGPNYIEMDGQYLEGTQQFRDDLSTVAVYRSTNSRPGAGVLGRANGQLGWQVYVDDQDAKRLRFGVVIDSQEYTLRSPDGLPFNDGQLSVMAAQRIGDRMMLHLNGKSAGTQLIPTKSLDPTTSVPMRVGLRTVGSPNGNWATQLHRLMFVTARLYGDEIAYLYNAGAGKSYSDLIADAGL